jgi:hypothetical protein
MMTAAAIPMVMIPPGIALMNPSTWPVFSVAVVCVTVVGGTLVSVTVVRYAVVCVTVVEGMLVCVAVVGDAVVWAVVVAGGLTVTMTVAAAGWKTPLADPVRVIE